MAYHVLTPRNSFVRFDGELPEDHCIFGQQDFCLPVLEESDVAFQFVVEADTVEEADALCTFGSSGINIGLVADCENEFDIEFSEQPERYRISPTQVLYNWAHGFPGMTGFYDIGACFHIQITVINEITVCSNCFQRIGSSCFNSVIEYGGDENAFGFNYCNSGAIESASETGTCEPRIIEFTSKTTLAIPYTAGLQALYGSVPTIQCWIYDGGGQLVNMGIQATFDAYPPNMINFDFGGVASGIIVIR